MTRTLPQPLLDAGFASWTALAEAAGLSRMHLCNIRRGRCPLTDASRTKLADALGIPTAAVQLVIEGKSK